MSLINRKIIARNHNFEMISEQMQSSSNKGKVLVKVSASGLNRADLLQVEGLYKAEGGNEDLGLELSGYVVETGQPVCALVSSGGHSEYLYVDKKLIMPIPKGMDIVTAAGLPEALVTCWLNLFKLGQLEKGQSILVHGGGSGVGSLAIQIARAYGCRVFATVGDDSKKQFCKALGVNQVYNYKKDDYAEGIKREGGCDLVLDILGGTEFNKTLSLLKKYGRVVLIAVMQGAKADVNLGSVLMKNITVYGSTLRSKTPGEKADLINNAVSNLYPLIESGEVRLQVDSIYDFYNFRDAFLRMESRQHLGKILLKR